MSAQPLLREEPRLLPPRRIPAPPSAPPYDDERPRPVPAGCVGALVLPFEVDRPAPPPRLRLVPAAPPGGRLPEAATVAGTVVTAALEGLAGRRPVSQLAPLATPAVCALVARRAALSRTRPSRSVPRVRSVHVSEPAPGAAEVCAVVELDGRIRALAARLDVRAGRWRCTALHVG